MVRVGLIDAAAEVPAPVAGPCRGCDVGLSRDAQCCAACAAARRRAYAHTERGRRMVRDSQRRYRAKRRGGFADQPGLVRLLGNELRLLPGALILPRRLWATLGYPEALTLERVTEERLDIRPADDAGGLFPEAANKHDVRVRLPDTVWLALALPEGRYPVCIEDGRLRAAIPAAPPPPEPEPEPPALAFRPPYYLSLNRSAYEALGSPPYLRAAAGPDEGALTLAPAWEAGRGTWVVQRPEGGAPRIAPTPLLARLDAPPGSLRGVRIRNGLLEASLPKRGDGTSGPR